MWSIEGWPQERARAARVEQKRPSDAQRRRLRRVSSRACATSEECLAFDIEGFDTDIGSEFLNYQLWRYFHHRAEAVQFTRSGSTELAEVRAIFRLARSSQKSATQMPQKGATQTRQETATQTPIAA